MNIFEKLSSYLSFSFVRYAIIAGIMISLCSALIGVSLVLKRYSMIGDGLSHVGFGALALATALGLPPLEVTIPAGINDDQSIALRGQGNAGVNGGPAGDVIVTISVKADPMFQRDGYDVWVNVPITYSQAVLGANVTVPTVDGKVEYTVPEGTQSGTKFRLRGKGIQYLNGRGRGDQYVVVTVEIPKKLNKTQREALKAFEDSLKDENYVQRKGFFKNLKDKFEGK